MVYLKLVNESNPKTPPSEDCHINMDEDCYINKSEDCHMNKTNVVLTTATAAVIIKGLFVFFLALAECSKKAREPGQAVYCYEADVSPTDLLTSIGAVAFGALIGKLAN